jgi:hypothetical protein
MPLTFDDLGIKQKDPKPEKLNTAGMNKQLSFGDLDLGPTNAPDIDATMGLVQDLDPDKTAKKFDISNITGAQPSTIEDNDVDELHRHVTVPPASYLVNPKDTPVLAKELAKPEKLAIAKDDLENLSLTERMFRGYKDMTDNSAAKFLELTRRFWHEAAGTARMAGQALVPETLFPETSKKAGEMLAAIPAQLAHMAETPKQFKRYGFKAEGWRLKPATRVEDWDTDPDGWLTMVGSEVMALPLILTNLAAQGMRGKIPLPFVMAGESLFSTYEESGGDKLASLMAGGEGYMFGSILQGLHYVPNWMGVKYLTGSLRPIPARMLAGAGAFGIPTWAGGGSEDEIIAQIVLGAGFYAKDGFVSMPEILNGSKLAQRSPEMLRDLVSKQIEAAGMPKDLYIDPKVLYQQNAHVRREFLEEFGIKPDQYAEALNLGHDIPIDHASFLMKGPKHHELYQTLQGVAKVHAFEEALTARRGEINQALEELDRQYDTLFQSPIDVPREPLEQLHEQIRASGRTKQEADLAVALYSAHARAMAARTGMSPAEYMSWRNLEVRKDAWNDFRQRLELKMVDPNKGSSYDPNSFRAGETADVSRGFEEAPGETRAPSPAQKDPLSGSKPEAPAVPSAAASGLQFQPDAVPPHLRGKADLATRIISDVKVRGHELLRRATGVVTRGFGAGKETGILYTSRDFSRFGTEAHDVGAWEALGKLIEVDAKMGSGLFVATIPKGSTKLEGQPLVQLSAGCHRNGALLSAINDGIIMPDVKNELTGCHGSCYKDWDQGAMTGGNIFTKLKTAMWRRGKTKEAKAKTAAARQTFADFWNDALDAGLKPADLVPIRKRVGGDMKNFAKPKLERLIKKFDELPTEQKTELWNRMKDEQPDWYNDWVPQEAQGVRVVSPDVVRNKIANLNRDQFLRMVNAPSDFIRGNQQGDWLMELRAQDKDGITTWEAYAEAMLSRWEKETGQPREKFPKQLSAVTAGWYADVPMEVLRRIADKYGKHLTLQVTGPIDFVGPEAALRLQGFKKLHDAGLNPIMRLITDEFQVGGGKLNDRRTVEMTVDFIIENGIRPEQILETPLHFDSPQLANTRIGPKDKPGDIQKKIESLTQGVDKLWELPLEEREVLARRILERNTVFHREDLSLPEALKDVGHNEVGLTYDYMRKLKIPEAKLRALQELGFYYKYTRHGYGKQEGVFTNRCCTTGKCMTCDSQCSARYKEAIQEGRIQHAVQILESVSPTNAASLMKTEMNELGQMRLKAPETLYQISRSGETLVNEFIGKNPAYRDIRFDGVWDPFAGVDMGDKVMPKYLQFTIIDGPQWVNGQKRARPTFNVEIKKDWTPEEAYESFRSKLQEFKEPWGDHETLFQSQAPWYSVMETVLEAKLPKTSSAENMLQQVRAYQGKNEFKAEEMEWSDIEGYLESRAGEKVTKQEIMDHVRKNQVKLIETVKEDSEMVDNILDVDAWSLRTRMGRRTGFTETYEHPELPDVYIERVHGDKWRIMLDDMIMDDTPRSLLEAVEKMPSTGLIEDITGTTSNTNHAEWQMDGPKSNYRETLIRLVGNDYVKPAHFTEKGIVVHIRHNDRIGPNGERILFIEEVQSDLHQAGRKEGYKRKPKDSGYTVKPNEKYDGYWDIINQSGEIIDTATSRAFAERIAENGGNVKGLDSKIPDAPYKKTKDWAGLAMRKMVRYAAENGYDAIAWTPGKVQSERYDLSGKYDSILYDRNTETLRAFKKPEYESDGSGEMLERKIPEGKLGEHVGKDLAEKLLSDEYRLEKGVHEVVGDDLKVDSKGMIGFYDEILPSIMKKTFRKKSWGKPQVGPMSLQVRESSAVTTGALRERGLDEHPIGMSTELAPDGSVKRIVVEDKTTGEKTPFETREEADRFANQRLDQIMGTAQGVWSMPITGEMRAKATREPMPLFQNDGKPLGATTFERQKTAITFFEQANKSTMPHELFHVFMDDMQKMSYSGQADAKLRKDWQTTLDWLGAKWGEELTIEQKEKFAKAGEAYLREGKAPTPALTKAFKTLRKWFLNIYRSIRPLGVNINDDMRQVFDRLLATEEEISAAKDFMELKSYWLENEGKGVMGDKAWSDYQLALAKAGDAADAAIRKRRIQEYTKLLKTWQKDADRIAESEPEVRFIDELRDAGGINRKAFEAVFGKNIARQIAAEHPRLFTKGGEIVQELVDRYGVSGPDELIGMLTTARNRENIAKELVMEKSREFDKAFQSDDAVVTPEYKELLAKEASALEAMVKEKTGQPLTDKQIERLVRGRSGKMTLEELARVFVTEGDTIKAAMQLAARASRNAFAAGDFEGALREKNRQRAMIAKMHERKRISEEIQTRRARLKRIAKSTTPDRGKGKKKLTVNWEHAEQIRDLLSRFDTGIKTGVVRPDKLQSLEEFIRENDDDTGALQTIPAWIRSAGMSKSIKKMTLEELRDLDYTVRMIDHLGRYENKILDSVRKENIDEAVGEMAAEISKRLKPVGEPQYFKVLETDPKTGVAVVKRVPYTRKDKTRLQRAAEAYDSAGLIKPEFLFRRADGYERGPFYDYLFRWAADAEVREFEMWEDVGGRMKGLFDKIPATERRHWGRKEHYVPNPTGALAEQLRQRPFSREEIIMVALNSGNEGNLKALREGYGWDLDNVRSITNMLTPKEWELVRGVWDLYERIRPELEKTNRKLTGTEMELVEGIEVETPFGIVQGGYFPLKFDEELSWFAGKYKEQDVEAGLMQSKFGQAATKAGMTKSRKGGAMPPKLRMDVVYETLMDSIHHTTHGVGVRDAGRLIQNPEFRAAFEEYMGADKYAQLMPWLQHIANPRPQYKDRFEYYLNVARSNASVVALGLRATTALKQVSAYTLTIDAVGLKPALEALSSFYAKPRETAAWVYDKSPYMRSRLQSWDREVGDMMRQWDPTAFKVKVGDKYLGKAEMQDLFFTWITMMDRAVAMPTWVAGYREGMKKFSGDEKMAIDHADMTVRTTQASASLKDLCGWQRGGPAKKILVPFYTAASVTLNRLMETKNKYSDGKITAGQAMMGYFWVLAAQSMIETWAGKPGLPDEDTKVKDVAKEGVHGIADMFVGSFPLLRDVGKIALDELFTGRSWSYDGPPAAGGIESAGRTAKELVKTAKKAIGPERMTDKDYRRLRKAAIDAGGYWYGLPSSATNQAIDGAMELTKGETKNPFVLFFRQRKEK